MADYGLTNDGPNIKRLDVILDEMHTDLSERWGVNTRQNPESFINHFLTNIADRIAELWEFGEQVYYSQYPSSADGISLDNAAQISSTFRKNARKSVYPIHCTGKEGAVLDTTTMVASVTNPVTQLTLVEESRLSRQAVNSVRIKVPGDETIPDGTYRYVVTLNGVRYETVTTATERSNIITAIYNTLTSQAQDTGFEFTNDAENVFLGIAANESSDTFSLGLSDNLTTDSVTCIFNFETTENGDINLPNETITAIVKAPAELTAVKNLCEYIPGRLVETDAEFRNSYFDTLFSGSRTMSESIRAAVLENVAGVKSVSIFENDTDETTSDGLPPHSIEVVVVCPNNPDVYQAIGEQVFLNKAAGIGTYGSEEVNVLSDSGQEVTIYLSVPAEVKVWWKLTVTPSIADNTDAQNEIKSIIIDYVNSLASGEDVIPQMVLNEIYDRFSTITYVDVETAKSATTPGQYQRAAVEIDAREVATTTANEVLFV